MNASVHILIFKKFDFTHAVGDIRATVHITYETYNFLQRIFSGCQYCTAALQRRKLGFFGHVMRSDGMEKGMMLAYGGKKEGRATKEKIDKMHEVTNEAGGTKRRDDTKETIEKSCHELTAQGDKTQFFCPHLNVSVNITIKKFHTCCTISEDLYKKLNVAKRISTKNYVYPQVGL